MFSYLNRNLPEAQRQKRRQRAARLSVVVAVFVALVSTYEAWPSPGKTLRPVIVAQLIATWLSVVVAALVVPYIQRRRLHRAISAGQQASGNAEGTGTRLK